MAEIFNRASIGPTYSVNTWVNLYQVTSTVAGALIFGFSITNTNENNDVTVEVRIIDENGTIVHYPVPSRTIEAKGVGFDTINKIVLKSGDKVQIKASTTGAVFYCALLSGIKTS